MAQVNYIFYTDTFCGTQLLSEVEFYSLLPKADAYISRITFGNVTEYTFSVKMAICAVCEALSAFSGHDGICSENNDGYSIHFVTDQNSKNRLFYQTAKMYLPDELLYAGVF